MDRNEKFRSAVSTKGAISLRKAPGIQTQPNDYAQAVAALLETYGGKNQPLQFGL